MTTRLTTATLAVLALTFALGGVAHADKPADEGRTGNPSGRYSEHCISPSGVDVNELWSIEDRVVAPFCPDALTGEKLTTTNIWVMSPTFEAVPEGFVPAGDTPLDDLRAKFAGVRYVIDPGTRRERTYHFDDIARLAVLHINDMDIVNIATMGSLHPLPSGEHVMETYWVFDAEHCDGIDPDRSANCFPAGETLYGRFAFDVASADS